MKKDEYPYNTESLFENLIEFTRTVETVQFSVADHDLKIEVLEQIGYSNRFIYKLYERQTISNNDKTIEVWIFVTHFPFDVADSANEALATALRWIEEYYPKKKKDN